MCVSIVGDDRNCFMQQLGFLMQQFGFCMQQQSSCMQQVCCCLTKWVVHATIILSHDKWTLLHWQDWVVAWQVLVFTWQVRLLSSQLNVAWNNSVISCNKYCCFMQQVTVFYKYCLCATKLVARSMQLFVTRFVLLHWNVCKISLVARNCSADLFCCTTLFVACDCCDAWVVCNITFFTLA